MQSLRSSRCSVRAFSTGRKALQVSAKMNMTRREPPKKAAAPPPPEPASDEVGPIGLATIAVGLVANPVTLWSAYTLKTTGEGLQGDALGALEGVSYLAIVLIIGASLYAKTATGRGLPAGPAGLLGAVEGFSYLSLLAAIVAFALKA